MKKKRINEMTNAELKKLNERKNLENQYKQLNPNQAQKAIKTAATVAAALGTVSLLYNNSKQVIKIGKEIANSVDGMLMRDISNAFQDLRID